MITGRLHFTVILVVAALSVLSCGPESSDDSRGNGCAALAGQTYRFSPPDWPDDRPPPKTLEESLSALKEVMSEEQKQLLSCPEVRVPPAQIHRGLAMWMRNRWQLYQDDSPLRADFARFNLSHPDDVSNLIARALIAELRGQPVEMEHWAAEYLVRREALRQAQEAAQDND